MTPTPRLTNLRTLGIAAFLLGSSYAAPSHAQSRPDTLHRLSWGQPRPSFAWIAPPETASTQAQPLVVQLHGMCNNPALTCSWFQPGQLPDRWQLCPQGDIPCGGSGFQWSGSPRILQALLQGSLDRARQDHASSMSTAQAVLVGYSQGAFAAVTAISQMPGRFLGLVLVSASVQPSSTSLRTAGIRRVALLCGEYDASRPTLQALATTLNRDGVLTRTTSLGRFGHVIPDTTSPIVAEAIQWAGEND